MLRHAFLNVAIIIAEGRTQWNGGSRINKLSSFELLSKWGPFLLQQAIFLGNFLHRVAFSEHLLNSGPKSREHLILATFLDSFFQLSDHFFNIRLRIVTNFDLKWR